MQPVSITEAVVGVAFSASLAFVGWLKYGPTSDPSALPKPSTKCRHCRNRWHDKWNATECEYHDEPALVAVKCPAGCTIEEPHLHKRCRNCEAEYPTQQ